MKTDAYKFFILDNDGNELEEPVRVRTTSLNAVKKFMKEKCILKYGEGNFKIKYTTKC